MPREIPPEAFESGLDAALPAEQRRQLAMNRRVFRAMLVDEMTDAPLTAARRREFLAYARRLGLDDFEARLFVRAVEYECGHVRPAALDDRPTDADLRYAAPAEPGAIRPWVLAISLAGLMVLFLVLDALQHR